MIDYRMGDVMSDDLKASSNWSGLITREKASLQLKFKGRQARRIIEGKSHLRKMLSYKTIHKILYLD